MTNYSDLGKYEDQNVVLISTASQDVLTQKCINTILNELFTELYTMVTKYTTLKHQTYFVDICI
jgi:hypothetical protein